MNSSQCESSTRPGRIPRAFLLLATTLALAGCATSLATTAAIQGFAEATTAASEGLQALDESAAARLAVVQRESVLERPVRVRAEEDSCLATSARCALVYRKTRDSTPVAFAPASLIPQQREIMQTIAAYADALVAMQEADATKEMNAAIDSASGSIARLGALAPPHGLALAAAAPAIGRAAKLAFSLWQEHVKRKATREAVDAMDPVLQEAARLMSDTARFASLPSKRVLADAYDAAEEKLRDGSATKGELDAYVKAARSLDAVLSIDDRAVFVQLGKAHAALREALTDPKVDFATAVQAIQAFASRANELLEIAQELRQAFD
jgi:hypothetical protein